MYRDWSGNLLGLFYGLVSDFLKTTHLIGLFLYKNLSINMVSHLLIYCVNIHFNIKKMEVSIFSKLNEVYN